MKAPFPWMGGKSRVAKLVWERLGNVPNYWKAAGGYGKQAKNGNDNNARERIWFSPACLKANLFEQTREAALV